MLGCYSNLHNLRFFHDTANTINIHTHTHAHNTHQHAEAADDVLKSSKNNKKKRETDA